MTWDFGAAPAGVAARPAGGLPALAARVFSGGGVALDQGLDGDGEGVRLVRGGDFSSGGEARAEFVEVNAGVGSRVTTTLKSLASSVPVVDWLVAIPVVRRKAWSPTSVTWPLKMRPGRASTVTSTPWLSLTLTMSVSSTLTSAVMTRHVGEGHEGGAFGVLDAEDDGFAFADGDVGDEAVKGCAADGLVEGVVVGALAGDGLIHVAALGVGLGTGLCERGLSLSERGQGHVISGFLGVVVLLGDEFLFVERLGAGVVEPLLLRGRPCPARCWLRRFFRRRHSW